MIASNRARKPAMEGFFCGASRLHVGVPPVSVVGKLSS